MIFGLIYVSATIILFLMVMFNIALTYQLIQGKKIDCGCGGINASDEISWWHVMRNSLYMLMAISLYFLPIKLINVYIFIFALIFAVTSLIMGGIITQLLINRKLVGGLNTLKEEGATHEH